MAVENPAHPSVDWSRAWRADGMEFVPIICPGCGKERVYRAKDVRARIRHRGFTGICQEDRRRRTPEHAAVDWSSVARRRGAAVVDVTCPVCRETRTVLAAAVRKAIEAGKFTGRCFAHRYAGRRRAGSQPYPQHPDIDWYNRVLVEAGGRRHSRLLVTCPACGRQRAVRPHSLAQQVRSGTFDARCRADRRRVPAAAGATGRS